MAQIEDKDSQEANFPDAVPLETPPSRKPSGAEGKLGLRDRSYIRSKWAYFLIVVLFDALVVAAVVSATVRWRYDFLNIPVPPLAEEIPAFVAALLCAAVWSFLGVPRAIWRFTSFDDVLKLGRAVIVAMLLLPLAMYLFVNAGAGFPRSTPILAGPIIFILLVAARLMVLLLRNGDFRSAFSQRNRDLRPAVLAGRATSLHNVLRDMRRNPNGTSVNVVGLFTTDAADSGRSIRGVPVIGSLSTLRSTYSGLAKKYDELPYIISVDDNLDSKSASALVKAASAIGAPLSRLRQGDSRTSLTPFEAQDLIGRQPRALEIEPVQRLVKGRSILVTGAGGSIGSELVRQVMRFEPQSLALFDHSEYNLYKIDHELADTHGERFRWQSYLGDVRDMDRLNEVFRATRPDVVLHAAALKHVPLGERNPIETLHTNVLGTRNVLDMCVKYEVDSFMLVSTDKAVNAASIMGASKFAAEQLTLAYNRRHPDLYASAVRFGNVLASTGSVVPLFEEQIARGGPVTVTHPDACRYFMTTEEATALVLQATALNATQRKSTASIYVLEMGEPVNISHLARQLIRLRGKVPDRDVRIEYTGLRDGETLAEHIVRTPETLESTYVDGVMRIADESRSSRTLAVMSNIKRIEKAVDDRSLEKARHALARMSRPSDAVAPVSDKVDI